MSSLRPNVKAVVITVFTLLFSHLAIYDLTSVSFFSPMEKAADFRFSDFYTLVANSSADASYEKDIAIVPVDGCNRLQIAEAISNIDFCAPAAIGLDIFFTPLPDSDSDPLAEALADCDNLVLPASVTAEGKELRISHGSYYDSVLVPSGGFAAINLEEYEDELDNVREFRKGFETADGAVNTLAAALAAIGRPKAYRALDGRTHKREEISYSSREFEILTPDEILDNQDKIEGRIVLVGKLQDRGDKHITPLDNHTPGLMIHAYILATIINGDYIRQLSEWEEIMLGALLCFLVVWINVHLMASVMGPLLVRSLQVGLLCFLIVTGTQAYIRLHLDLNFSYAILTVSLGVAACEVYGAIFDSKGLIDFIYTKYRKIITIRHEKDKNSEGIVVPDGHEHDYGAPCGAEDLQGEGGCDCEVGKNDP